MFSLKKGMFSLNGKVAIVTGGAGGLGEAMANALAIQGAKIALLDFKDGSTVVKKLKTKSKFYKINLLNEEEIKNTIELIKKDFGRIDILINNAGVYKPTPIASMTSETWDNILSINLRAYALMTKYSLQYMNSGSKIINVASVAGHHASENSSAYCASKGGVIQLTKTMAVEFAGKINVNAICPGLFVTDMTKETIKVAGDLMLKNIPMKRAGVPSEIGPLAVYLSSDESSYMTGSIITIDGGWTCHL